MDRLYITIWTVFRTYKHFLYFYLEFCVPLIVTFEFFLQNIEDFLLQEVYHFLKDINV